MIEIKLPEIGDGIESGDVLEVLVQEGDMIDKGQDIVELETDKATTGIPSTHAGKVVKIHVKEGDTTPIGATLISLEAVGASQPAGPSQPPQASAEPPVASPPAPQPAPALKSEPTEVKAKPPSIDEPKPARPPAAEPVVAVSDEIAAGPSIRRFARELGVDLSTVQGSGEGGRITREDVLTIVRQAGQAARSDSSQEAAGETDAWGPIHTEPLPKIRRTIAAKMHESWTTAPRVTNFDDADVTELEDFRQSSKADYANKGVKLTSLPFVIKAVAMALKSHPTINASLNPDGDHVIYKNYVNVGIAVDTERGLVVPSLRGPDDLSISEIANELSDLAVKVREGSFSLDDLRGGTFTISNLGAVGGAYSTPIINVPEVAILLVGRSRKMPVVVDDKVAIRLMMPLSLSYDHRLVDGAAAARFLNDVIDFLEAPSRLLLAP